ncbi:hypothetical protein HMPREF9622_02872 [Cutibacterium modestum HL037PA3]|uniref:Uncharacterized protein n=1 Tax=Cutibacterium modestum HL044PA1 TaxID=765109 RepID=A0ABN0C4X7_9ACTN|nr:hypothetical protein HMPREF9607_01768 [Cutibacterium modestum HL044PA1]EFT14105.1 hypothetical protein HMPREF9622_02872 [Cutibacterium modestum HL037PA3]EGG25666.1 hypothetical protein PA08_2617 [Cutibacterium modestum P08]
MKFHLAAEAWLQTSDRAQQGRLAGTIGADQPNCDRSPPMPSPLTARW